MSINTESPETSEKVNHPENSPLLMIRQWQVKACRGNVYAAAILSVLEYWHGIKTKTKKGRAVPLQYHTREELRGLIFNMCGEKLITEAIRLLQELGFITVQKNPRKGYKFDRKNYYLFDVKAVNAYLSTLTALKSTSGQNTSSMEPNDLLEEAKAPLREGEMTSSIEPNDLNNSRDYYTEIPPIDSDHGTSSQLKSKAKQVSKEASKRNAAAPLPSSEHLQDAMYKFYTREELIEQLRAAIDPKIQPKNPMEDWIRDGESDGTKPGFSNGIFDNGFDSELDQRADEIAAIWNEHTAGTISHGDGDELDERMLVKALIILDGYESLRQVLVDAVANNVPNHKKFLGWTDFSVFARNYLINKTRSQRYRASLISREGLKRNGAILG
jgi:hypothetical protein